MLDPSRLSNPQLDQIALRVDRKQVSAIDYKDFLSRTFPPRHNLLAPWLPKSGLAMIHAQRGVGKTHIAHGVAWAVATGRTFLRWSNPTDVGAHKVLLLDGEMPAAALKHRLQHVIDASEHAPPMPDYFRIAASDLTRDGLPDLADPAAQNFYADVVGDADLIVVDNLSTLCRSYKENEADSWVPIQNWLLTLRRQDKSALIIHHAGKSGVQRGSSRKEDALDSVIGLRRPPDYQADQGARFEIHFEKTRGFYGPDAEPFEVQFADGKWIESEIKSGDDLATITALHEQGMSVRQIADRTGLSKSSVQRRLEGRGD